MFYGIIKQIHLGVFNTVDIDYNKISLITLRKSDSESLFYLIKKIVLKKI